MRLRVWKDCFLLFFRGGGLIAYSWWLQSLINFNSVYAYIGLESLRTRPHHPGDVTIIKNRVKCWFSRGSCAGSSHPTMGHYSSPLIGSCWRMPMNTVTSRTCTLTGRVSGTPHPDGPDLHFRKSKHFFFFYFSLFSSLFWSRVIQSGYFSRSFITYH